MSEITQCRRKRNGYKSVVQKLCKKIESLLLEEQEDQHPNRDDLKQELIATNEVLLEKEVIIKELDGKIIDSIDDEEEFEKELEQSTEYEILLRKIHERVQAQFAPKTENVHRAESVASTDLSVGNVKSNVKLPKLILDK